MSCNFSHQTETNEPFTTDNTDSSNSHHQHHQQNHPQLDTSSLINIIPIENSKQNEMMNDKESYINNESSIQNTSDYSSIFNGPESDLNAQSNNANSQDIASSYVNCFDTSSSSFQMSETNQENLEANFNNNEQITYAISYPSDWQYDLDNLLNCYVAFRNIKTEDVSRSNTVRLKCSVCRTEFTRLVDLVCHKEENEFCRNNIEISTDFTKQCGLETINKKKFHSNSNYLESYSELNEENGRYEEVIRNVNDDFEIDTDEQDDENDEFDNDDDEDVENELLFDENIDSSDESSLNDDLSLYLNQKNGSLMRKSFKLRK